MGIAQAIAVESSDDHVLSDKVVESSIYNCGRDTKSTNIQRSIPNLFPGILTNYGVPHNLSVMLRQGDSGKQEVSGCEHTSTTGRLYGL